MKSVLRFDSFSHLLCEKIDIVKSTDAIRSLSHYKTPSSLTFLPATDELLLRCGENHAAHKLRQSYFVRLEFVFEGNETLVQISILLSQTSCAHCDSLRFNWSHRVRQVNRCERAKIKIFSKFSYYIIICLGLDSRVCRYVVPIMSPQKHRVGRVIFRQGSNVVILISV